MLTGDNRATADAIARQLASTTCAPRCCRGDKRDVVDELQRAGPRSWRWPATASTTRRRSRRPTVGIAMGTGTDVAIESAGITLVSGDLRGIVRARRLSRATLRNIRQNLFLAFVYNTLGVPIAAGVLYPVRRAADQPDLGERRDDAQLAVGDRQRAPARVKLIFEVISRQSFTRRYGGPAVVYFSRFPPSRIAIPYAITVCALRV